MTSARRDLVIKNLDLFINPEYASFITPVKNKMFDDLDTVVKPGEHFSCSFKIEVGLIPPELDLNDLLSSFAIT